MKKVMSNTGVSKIFVKICGITNRDDAFLAAGLGCDALGFNFVATSKRKVEIEFVKNVVKELPNGVMSVGIFSDLTPLEILRIVEATGLNGAQMHGNETFQDCQLVAKNVPFTIKALTADSPNLVNFEDFGVDFLLLDSDTPGEGKKFNWNLSTDMVKNERLLLAGGLDVENLLDGIERFSPFGVDVATGVEFEPGRKDPELLKIFIETAKSIRTKTE